MGKKRKMKGKERKQAEFFTNVMRRQMFDVQRSVEDDLIVGSVALVVSIQPDADVSNGTVGGHLTSCGVDLTLHSMMERIGGGPQCAYQVLTLMRDQVDMVYRALDEKREAARLAMAECNQQIIHYKEVGPDFERTRAARQTAIDQVVMDGERGIVLKEES